MVAIEHNPTHFEQPERDSLMGGLRLDGITGKKGRKNNGAAGIFTKLLAGLVNKKTARQPEAAAAVEVKVSAETGEGGKKAALKTSFSRLAEGKDAKNPKESLSLKKEGRQKETVPDKAEFDPLLSGFLPQAAVNDPFEKKQLFTPETVSLETENLAQVKEVPERRAPFKKGETAESSVQAETQKAALQFKKEEKALNLEEGQREDKAETKKSGKKRNTAALEIHDLRTQAGEAGITADRGLKGAEEIRNGPVEEIAVDLRPEARQGDRSEAQKAAPAGESFDQLLARELQGDLSADIVKQAAIVLRDGGEGTIKLSLKPETLGKVKIHLEMAENRISGHIIVESEEALRAFEREIHSLEQSFRDSGFEASLNTSLDYRNDGQRWKEKEAQPFFSERFAASYEEAGVSELPGFNSGLGFSAVNMFA